MLYSAKNLLLAGSLFLMVSIVSCQKDKGDETPEPTRKELLSHAWKVVDVRQGSETGASVINLPVPQVACLKDNTLTLKADNSFIFDEGTISCDPPMEAEGTWVLQENDSQIKLSSPGEDDIIIDIVGVDATNFKFKYEVDGMGVFVIILAHV